MSTSSGIEGTSRQIISSLENLFKVFNNLLRETFNAPLPECSKNSCFETKVKGTVSVISSDSPNKDDNVRLTAVPSSPLSGK